MVRHVVLVRGLELSLGRLGASTALACVPGGLSALLRGSAIGRRLGGEGLSDVMGVEVARFAAPSVTAYGTNEALRDPETADEPVGGGVRRERELAEAPLSSVRMA